MFFMTTSFGLAKSGQSVVIEFFSEEDVCVSKSQDLHGRLRKLVDRYNLKNEDLTISQQWEEGYFIPGTEFQPDTYVNPYCKIELTSNNKLIQLIKEDSEKVFGSNRKEKCQKIEALSMDHPMYLSSILKVGGLFKRYCQVETFRLNLD